MIPIRFPYGTASEYDPIMLDEIARNIREDGIQLVAIQESAHEDYRPFVYTIGLRPHGGPELIAFRDDATELDAVAKLFRRLAHQGRSVVPGERFRVEDRTLVAALPDPDFDRFLQDHCMIEARAYYGVPRVETLVLVDEEELGDHVVLH